MALFRIYVIDTGKHIYDNTFIRARGKQMTHEQIERAVEIKTNAADNALMNRRMTQAEYDFHMKALNRWVDMKYARIPCWRP
jgi:hypothetical protein